MQKVALFPGSFDPITKGHTDIVKRAAPLFDKLVVGIGNNTDKKYLFSLEQRQQWIENIFADQDKVTVQSYEGMTIQFCEKAGARYIIRGLRSSADFEFEKTVAQLNHSLNNNIETLFILSRPELSHISSTIVREIIVNGGDISPFVPAEVSNHLPAT